MSLIIGIACDRCSNAIAVDIVTDADPNVFLAAIRDSEAQAINDGWTTRIDPVTHRIKHYCTTCTNWFRHMRARRDHETEADHVHPPR